MAPCPWIVTSLPGELGKLVQRIFKVDDGGNNAAANWDLQPEPRGSKADDGGEHDGSFERARATIQANKL